MSAIFLSYRRDDSSGYAGRLFDNLAERFGRDRIFMDIETLEPGMDFVAGIDRAIESCGAVIVMIGPNWVRAQDSEGRRRLDNPHDFIRLEITAALTRGVRVIPVLVHNASVPPEQELPESLRPLCRLQACEISDNRWEFDVRRLADVIEPLIAEPAEGQPAASSAATAPAAETGQTQTPEQRSAGGRSGWLAAAAAAVLAAGGAAWWFSQSISTDPGPPPAAEPVSASPDAPQRRKTPAAPVPPSEPVAERTPVAAPSDAEPPGREKPAPAAVPDPRAAAEAEPVVPPEPRSPSADELRQREIAELIRAAESDLAALRLTRPAGDNAFERYQRVLELEPHNPTAREGLAAITERYQGMAEDALARGALDRAQRHLDSARTVDPDAAWLHPLQREIDQRRRAATRPEPAPRPDGAGREACLAACEHRHEACRAEINPDAEAECLRSREATCEQRYESCMADPSKLYMGQVSHESECIGVHIQCRRSAAAGCAAAPRIAEERCQSQLDECVQRCRDTD